MDESIHWMNSFLEEIESVQFVEQTQILLAPPAVFLSELQKRLGDFSKPEQLHISLCSQQAPRHEAGAYTGELSYRNLEDLGVSHVLVGHSETRRYSHSTISDCAQQVELAIQNSITPVLCVDKDIIEEQLAMLSQESLKKTIIAYEPIEAIGTGKAEELATTIEVVQNIRNLISVESTILYGGSVSDENVSQYTTGGLLSGVLVGSASLDPHKFAALIRAGLKA